jgi:hypothetical protein
LIVVGVGIAFLADDVPELGGAPEGLKLETAMIMFLFVPILIVIGYSPLGSSRAIADRPELGG